MKALDRKVWRDLFGMWGQALAIALVITGGVATFVMSLSTLASLRETQAEFYRDYRFSDVFSTLKRAPLGMKELIADIPGVETVDARAVAPVKVELEGFTDPVTGKAISLPDEDDPPLNRLYMRSGKLPEPYRDDEAVISDAFAAAHNLKTGDHLRIIINGRRKALTITGIAVSPEYIFQVAPGAFFPDFKRFVIIWMRYTPLATAYDMDGAFNDVVLKLSTDAREEDVIDRLDHLLEPYGGLGSYGRMDQISFRYLYEEFRQLSNMATIFPLIFLGVAAFLLNVVISRLVSTQREQVAALKAFGYGNFAVGAHYIKLVMAIVAVGLIGGLASGAWFGTKLSGLYMEIYKLPYLHYRLGPDVMAYAALVSVAAALTGTLYAVRRAALQPPAEAMRPESPAVYRQTLIERLGFIRFFAQPTRMIARHIERRPVKSLLSVTGIALSCAIMMVGSFFGDAVDYMVDIQFNLSERQDISVAFEEPTSGRALFELASLRGVEYAEPYRSVPVRLKFMHRSYRTSVEGRPPGTDLKRLLGTDLRPIELPPGGLVLTDHLGKVLGLRPGDIVTVEALEGERPVRQVRVAALVKQFIGVGAYMDLRALNRMMREGTAVSGAYLAVDPLYQQEIYGELDEMPRVAAVEAHKNAVRNFLDTMGEQVLTFAFFNTLLAGIIAFGVVYNSARITLSERGRELASLRVLGFTRAEISYILLGELAAFTLAAIPLGFIIGHALASYIIASLQTDLFRIPLVIAPSTYAFSAAVVLASAIVSAFVVRRRLDRLDLVTALKTRE